MGIDGNDRKSLKNSDFDGKSPKNDDFDWKSGKNADFDKKSPNFRPKKYRKQTNCAKMRILTKL